MTRVRGSLEREKRETIVTDEEMRRILTRADQIKDEFYRKRTKALVCVLRIFGKRRGEVARVKLSDVDVTERHLKVTFTLLKKRQLQVLQKRATKAVVLSDPLVDPILEWLNNLADLDPIPQFLFPRTRSLFGAGKIILETEHISGRQVFNILRSVSDRTWPHLYRETAACDVILKDSSIFAAFKVMRRLDVKDFRTGLGYVRRFAADVIQRQTATGIDTIERKG